MKRLALALLLFFILTACALLRVSTAQPTPQPATVSPTESVPSSGNETDSSAGLTRSDQQGAVVIEVTPLNLDTATGTLEFDIAMNTHSVDLSMDLAALATLTTDTGVTVQATKWDAVPGGHHVEGKLIFPAAKDDQPILEGASKLTLTIINVDAPSRVFEWELK